MVCLRCKMVVESILQQLGINYASVELGTVNLLQPLTPEQLTAFNTALKVWELELISGTKSVLVENIKISIIKLFHESGDFLNLKFSEYLSRMLGYDYTYMANVFTEAEGSTIERFYIVNKTERVKELIVYEALSLKEIAGRLNYSSVSHLCLQFKKITGTTPSEFRRLCDTDHFVWRKV